MLFYLVCVICIFIVINNNAESGKKKVVKNQRQFIDSWLNDELFKDRLRKDLGDTKIAKCVVCHKTIELSSSGRSTLTDHAKGEKHKDTLHKVKSFWGKANDKPSSCDSSSSTANTVATNSQTTIGWLCY